jgi:hypothetical protein
MQNKSTRITPRQFVPCTRTLQDPLTRRSCFRARKHPASVGATNSNRCDLLWLYFKARLFLDHHGQASARPQDSLWCVILLSIRSLLTQLTVIQGFQPSFFADTISTNTLAYITARSIGAPTISSHHSSEDQSTGTLLAKRNYLRLQFTELALFLRGSVISAIFSTWQLFAFPRWQSRDDRYRTKFESLFRWKNICAVCGKELEGPDGELPDQFPSVGMKDTRLGSFLSRSGISGNRGDVYDCFSGLTSGFFSSWNGIEDTWSHGVGVIFFYYAELYHPQCKPSREKEIAVHVPKETCPAN